MSEDVQYLLDVAAITLTEGSANAYGSENLGLLDHTDARLAKQPVGDEDLEEIAHRVRSATGVRKVVQASLIGVQASIQVSGLTHVSRRAGPITDHVPPRAVRERAIGRSEVPPVADFESVPSTGTREHRLSGTEEGVDNRST
jgi:hypothetical protein